MLPHSMQHLSHYRQPMPMLTLPPASNSTVHLPQGLILPCSTTMISCIGMLNKLQIIQPDVSSPSPSLDSAQR